MQVVDSGCCIQETISTSRMSVKGPLEYSLLSIAIPQRVKGVARRKKESVIGNGPGPMRKLLNNQRHQSSDEGRQGVRNPRPRRPHHQRPDRQKGGKRNSCCSLFPSLIFLAVPIQLVHSQFPYGPLCAWFGYIQDTDRYSVAGCEITSTCCISGGHSLRGYHLREQIGTKTSPLSFDSAKKYKECQTSL